jgi:superfamily II DNA or RNA helicase
MQLTDTQKTVEAGIHEAWASHNVVLAVLPTGAGKTHIAAKVIADQNGTVAVMAHRQELVGQLSIALCKRGVRHNIIGTKGLIKFIVGLQTAEMGTSFYNPQSTVTVAGVDTVLRRADRLRQWASTVDMWFMDEGHHIQRRNKWGKVAAMFGRARGLTVSASPARADGRGLGSDSDGLIDAMVVGPSGREMIEDGYLTDYRIFAPPSRLDLSRVDISRSTGDYMPVQLREEVRRAQIVGDVVSHYQRIAAGLLGITFTVDVETATETAAAYNAAGVPAEVVSAKTPDIDRARAIRRFKRREISQLVNVDLFGEGFDVPAVEVVSFARPTASYVVYSQQFGRALRPFADGVEGFYQLTRAERLTAITASQKPHALIIDHVGNVRRHGLPDGPRHWTLDRRESDRRACGSDHIPVTVCPACTAVFQRMTRTCPYCGHYAEPAGRSRPEQVDGNLCELSAEALELMRAEIAHIDQGAADYRIWLVSRNVPLIGQMRRVKDHVKRQRAQSALRYLIGLWAEYQRGAGRSDIESYKLFYWRFGVDVGTAQTLGRADAVKLAERITMFLGGL